MPLLMGVRTALSRQVQLGGTATWQLSRAHLMNGGEEFVADAVALLRSLGYEPALPPTDSVEAGGTTEETAWTLRARWWSRSELRGLVGLVRIDGGAAPAGRLITTEAESLELLPDPPWFSWCAVL